MGLIHAYGVKKLVLFKKIELALDIRINYIVKITFFSEITLILMPFE